MNFTSQKKSALDAIQERSFMSHADGRSVPVHAWFPVCDVPRPLVLVGHGGSGHKRSKSVLDIAERLARNAKFVVAAIDGPLHGERRGDGAEPAVVRDEFRALWERGGSVEGVVNDWRAALDDLCAFEQVDASAVGYYGLSMGTAYGLPLLAAESRIRAAVIGMWGTSRVNSERLLADAQQLKSPSLFIMQWDDPLFSREGQLGLFDKLASVDKQLRIYPGGHIEPDAEKLDDIAQFLVRRLDA
ncbi:MAG: dienelactone hydrolase family protein [Chthoniobacteraceae bacterium]|nr:dienelactone hydrolase family protein [Chthoniobacteraceae bacterium]